MSNEKKPSDTARNPQEATRPHRDAERGGFNDDSKRREATGTDRGAERGGSNDDSKRREPISSDRKADTGHKK